MRIAALFGLAALMLAVIFTVAPKVTLASDEISGETYATSFTLLAQR
jgi:hypothetical protein